MGKCVKILKTTKSYFILGSDSDPESKTLIIISRHYLSLYTWLVPLSINTWPTSSSLLLWILDHYTLPNIKLLNRAVSLLGTGFLYSFTYYGNYYVSHLLSI